MIGLPDDSSLTPEQRARIRQEAERALKEAGAFGVFPTPVDQIMRVANVVEIKEDVLSPGFLDKLRKSANTIGGALKSALSKVQGVFHAVAGNVYIDQTLYHAKKTFVRLHEAAHGFLSWQRPIYALVEDCEKAIEPNAAELFDREANVFASEVLFQLDTFRDFAESKPFGIWTPINLAKKFDASLYSSIRQYVSKNSRCCAVIVLNMPQPAIPEGFTAALRRMEPSESFQKMFGRGWLRAQYTPDDKFGALVPLGKRRASGKHSLSMTDMNGDHHECIVEAFSSGQNVFILIHAVKALSASRIILSAA
ncbi:MAG: ImmA/IrrE family metallo-endopeptidase [Sphingomonadaceae bacterium]|nr:ImmA/IrrE family metallo-endopeptidase [Sphingomonadaceae bacterium]